MSDVPLGVFLSGGLDSSFATGAMCKHLPAEKVQGFTIGFREKSYDESDHARAIAKTMGILHHVSILDFDDTKSLMEDVLCRLDEPLGDASILPTYLLCQFASTRVKVALSGDGGDELFAGYDPFVALKLAELYKICMPRFAHRGVRCLAELLPKSTANMSFDFKLRRVLQGLDYGPELWNPVWLAPLEIDDIENIFNESVKAEELYSEALTLWNEDPAKGTIDKTLEFYSNYYLPDDILTKVDRAAMLNGLEVRSVFLDNDLAEFVRHLPANYKVQGNNRKIVLKKAAAGLLSQSVLDRPKKGFGVPISAWLRQWPMPDTKRTENIALNATFLAQCWTAHKHGREDNRGLLWAWLCLDRCLINGRPLA